MAKKRTTLYGFGKRHQRLEEEGRELARAGDYRGAQGCFAEAKENRRRHADAITSHARWLGRARIGGRGASFDRGYILIGSPRVGWVPPYSNSGALRRRRAAARST